MKGFKYFPNALYISLSLSVSLYLRLSLTLYLFLSTLSRHPLAPLLVITLSILSPLLHSLYLRLSYSIAPLFITFPISLVSLSKAHRSPSRSSSVFCFTLLIFLPRLIHLNLSPFLSPFIAMYIQFSLLPHFLFLDLSASLCPKVQYS